MEIQVKNMDNTGVTIKEVHVIFPCDISPDNPVYTIDTDVNSYAVKVTYAEEPPNEQLTDKSGKTTPLSGNSIVTLIRQHDKGTFGSNKMELHLEGTSTTEPHQ